MVHARLEIVVFGAADVLVNWLDDMPLTLVLITAADAGCTGMCSVALNFTSFTFRAAQSLPSPLLFRARGLLTISVAV
jgi:hypothetical protein